MMRTTDPFFADYLRELQQVALLTPEEEALLWAQFRAHDDAASRARLIEAYQPLVFKVAMQLRPPDALLMDAIQEGTVGLIEAVERFDPARGVRFSTFATYRIRGAILNALHRERADASLDQLVEETGEAALATEGVLQRVEDEVLAEKVRQVIADLPPRERAALRALMGEAEPRAVAVDLRVSLSHFYRIQRQALERVRAVLAGPPASADAARP
jgi:RNA polymerase sporulation-specific sigma factor